MATDVRDGPLAELLTEATGGRLNGMQLSHLIQDIRALLKDDMRIDRQRHVDNFKRQNGMQKGYLPGYEVGYDQALLDLDNAGSLLGATARQRKRERDGQAAV